MPSPLERQPTRDHGGTGPRAGAPLSESERRSIERIIAAQVLVGHRRGHSRFEGGEVLTPRIVCLWCDVPWPCIYAQWAADVTDRHLDADARAALHPDAGQPS